MPRKHTHPWLVVLDYLFYLLVIAALYFFVSYLYSYRDTITLLLPLLLQGAVVTIVISLVSMVLAVIFGFLGALGRLSPLAPLRWLAMVYTEVVRGTPILVQLLLWYYGVGYVLSTLGFDPYGAAFQVMTALQNNSLVPQAFSAYFYGIIGLSFNYGAYLTEVFRSGIQGVERGQTEAALSIGLSPGQAMRRVILPQAIRLTIPPFTNYFITLIQDSSLLSVIAVLELEQVTSSFAYPQTDAGTKMFIFVLGALLYLAICYPLSLLSGYLEKRLGVAY
jgi:His/Glu/Gln/Arg/opine family amino acid ABC transporter permease subunit